MNSVSQPVFRRVGYVRAVLSLWWFVVALKVLSHFVALAASYLRACTERELTVPIWPPSWPIGVWLERVWFAPFERWDTIYYMRIVDQGYGRSDGTAPFHPLYPLLASPFARLGLPTLPTLMLVSFAALLAVTWALLTLLALDRDLPFARDSVYFVLSTPFVFPMLLPYPEALFLLLSVLTFCYARRQKWLLAGSVGALAALTRQQGVLLIVPLAFEWLMTKGEVLRSKLPLSGHRLTRDRFNALVQALALPRALFSFALVLSGYLIWVGYRAIALRDVVPNLESLHQFIYTVLVSPSATEVVEAQRFLWPWQALSLAVDKLKTSPDVDIWINVAGSVFFLTLLFIGWNHMRVSSKAYVVVNTLVSFSFYTGPRHPYMGLLRHLMLGFPALVGASVWAHTRLRRRGLALIGLLGGQFLVFVCVLETYVP